MHVSDLAVSRAGCAPSATSRIVLAPFIHAIALAVHPCSSVNPNTGMIHPDDRRRLGNTTIVFFDGHCEQRPQTPEKLPVSLFNPLDTTPRP